jgi:hypothetical protein
MTAPGSRILRYWGIWKASAHEHADVSFPSRDGLKQLIASLADIQGFSDLGRDRDLSSGGDPCAIVPPSNELSYV